MLDHHHTVPAVHQRLQHGEQPLDVVAVEPGRGLVQQEQRTRRRAGAAVRAAGKTGQVADELEPLGLAAAERVERLAKREVTEADGLERGEAGTDGRVLGEERQRVQDARGQQVGDGAALPGDREHLGLEAPPLAHRARDEDVGEELHLDPLVAEALAVVAAALAAVEGEGRGVEAGLLRGRRAGVELADEVPGLGVQRGVGARRARERGLVDEDDLADLGVGGEAGELRGVLGELGALGEQALVDDVVEQGGLARARDAAQAHEAPQRQPEGEVAQVVLGGAGEVERGMIRRHGPARRRRGENFAAGEIGAGDAGGRAEQGRHGALEHDVPAAAAGLGPDLDHVVRGADHGLVVLDHDHRVARVGQRADDGDQAVDVARVEADAGLVEDEQGVDQRGAEAAGEVDALDFTARERL